MSDLKADLSLLGEDFQRRIEEIKKKHLQPEPQELGIGWYVSYDNCELVYRTKDKDNFAFINGKAKTTSCYMPEIWHRPTPSENEEITRLMTEEVKRRFMGKTVRSLGTERNTTIINEKSKFGWSKDDKTPSDSFWVSVQNDKSNYSWCRVWSAEKGFAEVVEEKLTIGGVEVKKDESDGTVWFNKYWYDEKGLSALGWFIEDGGEIKFNNEVLTLEKINQLRELANK